jgi:hypothetical protein
MVVVVKNGIRLPRLPPICFEIHAGMIDDAMVIRVQGNDVERKPVYGNGEQGQDVHQLNMERFYGVDGRDRKRRGLFVLVMELVKVTVKERYVVNPVHPICHIILVNKNGRPLEDKPQPAVVRDLVINGAVAPVGYVAGQHPRQRSVYE